MSAQRWTHWSDGSSLSEGNKVFRVWSLHKPYGVKWSYIVEHKDGQRYWAVGLAFPSRRSAMLAARRSLKKFKGWKYWGTR